MVIVPPGIVGLFDHESRDSGGPTRLARGDGQRAVVHSDLDGASVSAFDPRVSGSARYGVRLRGRDAEVRDRRGA
jgi:hypothetical protein